MGLKTKHNDKPHELNVLDMGIWKVLLQNDIACNILEQVITSYGLINDKNACLREYSDKLTLVTVKDTLLIAKKT